MNTREPFAIVSPELKNIEDSDNDSRVEHLKQTLNSWGVPYKEVIGYFDGVYERSFVIRDTATARMIGILYNQDSVLELDANGNAWLVSPGLGESEMLGPFVETKNPELQQAFTYDPEQSKYWTVKSVETEEKQ